MPAKIFRALILAGAGIEIGLLALLALPAGTPGNLPGDIPGAAFVLPLAFIVSAVAILVATLFVDRKNHPDWARSLPVTAGKFRVPKKILGFFVSELQLLAEFFRIFSSEKQEDNQQLFGYSKTLRVVIFAVFGLSIVEIVVVHLAVTNRMWSAIILIVSIYSVILLLGFYTSMRRNPHALSRGGLIIRQGTRFSCRIDRTNIESIQACQPGDGGSIAVSSTGGVRVPVFNAVNVQLKLREPVTVYDLYLGKLTTSVIAFFCDEQQGFIAAALREEKQS